MVFSFYLFNVTVESFLLTRRVSTSNQWPQADNE